MKTAVESLNSFSMLDFLLFIKSHFKVAVLVGVAFSVMPLLLSIFGDDVKVSEIQPVSQVMYRTEVSISPTYVLMTNLSIHQVFMVNSLGSRINEVLEEFPLVEVEKLDAQLFKLARKSQSVEEGETVLSAAIQRVQDMFKELEQPLLEADKEDTLRLQANPKFKKHYKSFKQASFGKILSIPVSVVSPESSNIKPVAVLAFLGGLLATYMCFGLLSLVRLLTQYETELNQ